MRSRRLQILITLMFVTMMFVQTPAIVGTNASLIKNGSNTNASDYQNDNQFSYGKTSSTDTGLKTSNLNANTQVSSSTSNLGIYNQSGTVMQTNSTYYHPGEFVNINVNSSQISNFNYTNSFTYQLQSQNGNLPFNNVTSTPISNTTTVTTRNITQAGLLGSMNFNSTSISSIYGVNISNIVATAIDPTTEMITWTTVGNTTSTVSYGLTNGNTTTWSFSKTMSGFRNNHVIYLKSLTPNTLYYFQPIGTDYFGRVIKGATQTFTTTAVTVGVPTISSVNVIFTGYTNVTIQFTSNIKVNYSIAYSKADIGPVQYWTNSIDYTPQNSPPITISGLSAGTRYIFSVTAINSTNNALKLIDNNNGYNYTFTTKPLQLQTAINPTVSFNKTSSEVTVTFTTNTTANASIYYSLDPYFASASILHTNYDNASFFHTITFSILRAVTYFYYVNVSIGSSSLTTGTSYVIVSSYISNSFSGFSFTTPKQDSQDVNLAKFNFVLQLPLYPAILGEYQFTLSVNGVAKPGLVNPKSLSFNIVFLVNDTILFTLAQANSVLVQRGTYTNSSTYPLWMQEQNTTYSPTENLLFIGKLAYQSTSSKYINSSELQLTGLINLYFGGKEVSVGSSNIFDVPTAETTLLINSSFFSGLGDQSLLKVLNVKIPAKDIYGNMDVQMGITFPKNQGWSNGFTQYSNFTSPLQVHYRLKLESSTGSSSYSLTTPDFVGSATIIPLADTNVESVYPTGNQTNFIPIPSNEINLTLNVIYNVTSQVVNIFEFSRQNYTWFWNRKTLESTLPTGQYTLNLLWKGNDGSARSVVASADSVYNTPKEFVYSFNLTVSFTVYDLTANITVIPDSTVLLRFKIVVPDTNIAWDQDLGATVDGKAATYDKVTGEYRVNVSVSASESLGLKTATVSASKSLVSDTLNYIVASELSVSTSAGANNQNTNSLTEEPISLIGFGMFGAALVATVVYAAYILFTLRKK